MITSRAEVLNTNDVSALLAAVRARLMTTSSVDPTHLATLKELVADLEQAHQLHSYQHRSSNETNRTLDAWISIFLEQSCGFLAGKFDINWRVNGHALTTETGAFVATEGLNADPRQLLHLRRTTKVTSFLYNRYRRTDVNFLVVSEPDEQLGRELRFGDVAAVNLSYLMWSHKSYTPDSRGHHLPLEFAFFLPQPAAQQFLVSLENKPELIESIFQNLFRGLTSPTNLRRTQTDTLEVILSTEELRLKLDAGTLTALEPVLRLKFGVPIGEVPH